MAPVRMARDRSAPDSFAELIWLLLKSQPCRSASDRLSRAPPLFLRNQAWCLSSSAWSTSGIILLVPSSGDRLATAAKSGGAAAKHLQRKGSVKIILIDFYNRSGEASA